jgi:hypothetical protein
LFCGHFSFLWPNIQYLSFILRLFHSNIHAIGSAFSGLVAVGLAASNLDNFAVVLI